MEFVHIPVLKNETIENLNIRENGVYVDGTLGGAGHSKAIQEQANKQLETIDVDVNYIVSNIKEVVERCVR